MYKLKDSLVIFHEGSNFSDELWRTLPIQRDLTGDAQLLVHAQLLPFGGHISQDYYRLAAVFWTSLQIGD